MPIFDARTWFAHKAAKLQREIAVTQYEKAIQNAFREVADAVVVRGTVDQEVAAQRSLVQAFAETYRLSNSHYTLGIDNYLAVPRCPAIPFCGTAGVGLPAPGKGSQPSAALRRSRRRLGTGKAIQWRG